MRDKTVWTRATIYAVIIAGYACAPASQTTSSAGGAASSLAGGWIDATATLDPSTTPVYQGDAPMKFDFLKDMRKGDGFTLSAFSLGAHSGTHIDAPLPSVGAGGPIDRLPLDGLIGPARIIDIPDSVQSINAAELSKRDWKG